LLFLPSSLTFAQNLTDISSHWARAEIEEAVKAGYIGGYPDKTFKPDKPVTRAELIKITAKATGLQPRLEFEVAEEFFPDAANHWLAKAGYLDSGMAAKIAAAWNLKPGEILEPDKPATRWEAAALIETLNPAGTPAQRGTKLLEQGLVKADKFADLKNWEGWGKPFIGLALMDNLITGFADGTFRPNDTLTRAQAVVIIQRLLKQSRAATPNPPTEPAAREGFEAAKVVRVIDGDTIEVQFTDGHTDKVRLIGVNTPESTIRIEPYGEEASNFTKKILESRTVYLEKDVSERDKYQRLLRLVWLELPDEINEQNIRGKMFNAILVLEGYAQVATFPPDVKYADYFVKFQREAREAGRGLWGAAEKAAPPAAETGGVIIESIDRNAEVVVLRNTGSAQVNLTGWKLVSEKGNQTFIFPEGTVIPAGEVLKVLSGPKAAPGPGVLVWTKSYIWNNDGDPGALYDAQGKLVSQFE
jgi:endonuclease YncB( thermonuclease family)